jgi:phospholipase C
LDQSPGTLETIASQLDGYQFENGSIFDALDSKELDWRIYHGDAFPQVGAMAGMDLATMASNYHDLDDLASDLQDSDFDAAYVFIEPDYGHIFTHDGNFQCGNSQHPLDDVTRGDNLIKYVYESIRRSPHWESSMLVVTYDEHGGFYDHVPPPPGTPPGDIIDPYNNKHGFRFDHLGVRVPALVISPLIPSVKANGVVNQNCNLIDHTQYDHGSLLATIEQIYGLSPLTSRDATAKEFSHLLSLKTPRTDAPWTLPEAANSGFNCNDDASNPPSGPAGPLDAPVQPDGSRPIGPSLRGFVELAGIIDARLHPTEKASIAKRVRELSTVGAAHAYLTRINIQLQAHRQTQIATGMTPEIARKRRMNRRKSVAKNKLG